MNNPFSPAPATGSHLDGRNVDGVAPLTLPPVMAVECDDPQWPRLVTQCDQTLCSDIVALCRWRSAMLRFVSRVADTSKAVMIRARTYFAEWRRRTRLRLFVAFRHWCRLTKLLRSRRQRFRRRVLRAWRRSAVVSVRVRICAPICESFLHQRALAQGYEQSCNLDNRRPYRRLQTQTVGHMYSARPGDRTPCVSNEEERVASLAGRPYRTGPPGIDPLRILHVNYWVGAVPWNAASSPVPTMAGCCRISESAPVAIVGSCR